MTNPSQPATVNQLGPPPPWIFRIANKVIRPLLASPFHKPLSSRLMLLTYTGRKSGRRFTIPIGYFDWDSGTVLALSNHLAWVINLRDEPTVVLRIRGRNHKAVPAVIEEPAEIVAVLKEFANRKGPKAAKGLMLGLPGDRQPTEQELRDAAARTRLVRFQLTS
ncbi:DUF385 domain-containing protein [Rhodococcus sp. WB9]|uniref:nitroreductase/quinone reductase family protein n=1 Tax=Rhodococcus sp. WB9 TaxID=2594007 RepID=UPI00118572B2|nr:nitroreductase/quinone reductase family protein [Rhodococcus sp. WB9]QDQ92526.1 DUF385 domain-containing protein [Rhodococcus sp. WB9]